MTHRIPWGFFLPFAYALIFLLPACEMGNQSPENNMPANIVATVNGEEVSIQKFKEELSLNKLKYRVGNKNKLELQEITWLKMQSINQLVRDILLLQTARKHGIKLRDEVFRESLNKIKSDYQDESFKRYLDNQYISQT